MRHKLLSFIYLRQLKNYLFETGKSTLESKRFSACFGYLFLENNHTGSALRKYGQWERWRGYTPSLRGRRRPHGGGGRGGFRGAADARAGEGSIKFLNGSDACFACGAPACPKNRGRRHPAPLMATHKIQSRLATYSYCFLIPYPYRWRRQIPPACPGSKPGSRHCAPVSPIRCRSGRS